jgi:hypothetical protein
MIANQLNNEILSKIIIIFVKPFFIEVGNRK